MNQKGASKYFLPYLDSARGLAAMLVVLHHFFLYYPFFQLTESIPVAWVHSLFDGRAPVRFFFVLSGFVLAIPFFEGRKTISVSEFFKYFNSRLFRIYPLFVVVLMISASIVYFFDYTVPIFSTSPPRSVFKYMDWTNDALNGLFDEINLFVISRITQDKFVPQAWTLSIELINSLLIPFIIIVMRYSYGICLISVILFAKFGGANEFIIDFFIGVSLVYWKSEVALFWRKINLVWKIALLVLGLVFFHVKVFMPGYIVYYIGKYLIDLTSIGSTMLLVVLLYSKKLQVVFNLRLLRVLGKFSYSIYMCHIIILAVVTPHVIFILNQWSVSSLNLILTLALISTILASLILSVILFYLVELPCIKVGKYFNTQWSKLKRIRIVFLTRDKKFEILKE